MNNSLLIAVIHLLILVQGQNVPSDLKEKVLSIANYAIAVSQQNQVAQNVIVTYGTPVTPPSGQFSIPTSTSTSTTEINENIFVDPVTNCQFDNATGTTTKIFTGIPIYCPSVPPHATSFLECIDPATGCIHTHTNKSKNSVCYGEPITYCPKK